MYARENDDNYGRPLTEQAGGELCLEAPRRGRRLTKLKRNHVTHIIITPPPQMDTNRVKCCTTKLFTPKLSMSRQSVMDCPNINTSLPGWVKARLADKGSLLTVPCPMCNVVLYKLLSTINQSDMVNSQRTIDHGQCCCNVMVI